MLKCIMKANAYLCDKVRMLTFKWILNRVNMILKKPEKNRYLKKIDV